MNKTAVLWALADAIAFFRPGFEPVRAQPAGITYRPKPPPRPLVTATPRKPDGNRRKLPPATTRRNAGSPLPPGHKRPAP